MAQVRSTKIISIIKRIRTSRLSINNALSLRLRDFGINLEGGRRGGGGRPPVSGCPVQDPADVWGFEFRVEGLRSRV